MVAENVRRVRELEAELERAREDADFVAGGRRSGRAEEERAKMKAHARALCDSTKALMSGWRALSTELKIELKDESRRSNSELGKTCKDFLWQELEAAESIVLEIAASIEACAE